MYLINYIIIYYYNKQFVYDLYKNEPFDYHTLTKSPCFFDRLNIIESLSVNNSIQIIVRNNLALNESGLFNSNNASNIMLPNTRSNFMSAAYRSPISYFCHQYLNSVTNIISQINSFIY